MREALLRFGLLFLFEFKLVRCECSFRGRIDFLDECYGFAQIFCCRDDFLIVSNMEHFFKLAFSNAEDSPFRRLVSTVQEDNFRAASRISSPQLYGFLFCYYPVVDFSFYGEGRRFRILVSSNGLWKSNNSFIVWLVIKPLARAKMQAKENFYFFVSFSWGLHE